MTRAAAMAAELAAKATRYSLNRRGIRWNSSEQPRRILNLIEKIQKLDDRAAGPAKAESLAKAWEAYSTLQKACNWNCLSDGEYVEHISSVGSTNDLLAAADIDGYALSRINTGMIAAEQAYEGWSGDYADWN